MNKYALFAFNGNAMCFVHVLLNALDLKARGAEAVAIVIEGEAVKLVHELETSKNPLYMKAKEQGLMDCICKACSAKMGVLEFNESTGIPVTGDMSGHPSMGDYLEKGNQIITFKRSAVEIEGFQVAIILIFIFIIIRGKAENLYANDQT